MNVEVAMALPTEATLEWFREVFSEPSNVGALPADCHVGYADWLFEQFRIGKLVALIPSVDGVAAGLFYGFPMPGNAYSVEQFIMPKFRGPVGLAIGRKCSETCFDFLRDVNHLFGFISHNNRRSIIFAERYGFRICGNVPRFFQNADGSFSDCVIMVKERQ